MRTTARCLLGALLLLGSCGAPARIGVVADAPPPAAAASPAWRETLSAAGSWRVRWRSAPSPIPVNAPFRLVVRVEDALDRAPAPADVTLSVDAGMPSHGHGMLRVPRVVPGEAGRFVVEDLLFHMPGPWELYLDVARDGIAERAQFSLEVD